MPRRDVYKVLSEKYESLYTEAEVVRQISFNTDQLKVLTALYDFKKIEKDAYTLKRIVSPGIIEHLVKYSDNTYVCLIDDSRGTTKKQYDHFYDLVQALTKNYKADTKLAGEQTPVGPDEPYGVEPGGQH